MGLVGGIIVANYIPQLQFEALRETAERLIHIGAKIAAVERVQSFGFVREHVNQTVR
jgi:hypothetical protein